jgi:hypothetical protein
VFWVAAQVELHRSLGFNVLSDQPSLEPRSGFRLTFQRYPTLQDQPEFEVYCHGRCNHIDAQDQYLTAYGSR